MGFYVFPFYLFIASQLHGYLISHLLGLGLRAACPWRSLCPQVPTQISGNQFSVQRLSTSFFFSTTGHGKWKTLPEAHIFAPITKWWVGRRSFPFWEGLFSGATVVFGLDFHGIVLFPGQVTSGFLAASAGKVSAWLCDFARCSKKKRERLLSFMSRDFRYSQLPHLETLKLCFCWVLKRSFWRLQKLPNFLAPFCWQLCWNFWCWKRIAQKNTLNALEVLQSPISAFFLGQKFGSQLGIPNNLFGELRGLFALQPGVFRWGSISAPTWCPGSWNQLQPKRCWSCVKVCKWFLFPVVGRMTWSLPIRIWQPRNWISGNSTALSHNSWWKCQE